MLLILSDNAGRQSDTGNIFVGGFILGGLIVGALGYVMLQSFKFKYFMAMMSAAMSGLAYADIGFLRMNDMKGWRTRNKWVRASVASSPSTKKLVKEMKPNLKGTVRVGILGASGYTSAEMVRLLASHPNFYITMMTADRKAGQSIGSVFPHLITQDLPDMIAIKDAKFSDVDALFCCLPHGTTQEIIKSPPKELNIVDLSTDF